MSPSFKGPKVHPKACPAFEASVFSNLPSKECDCLSAARTENGYLRKQIVFYEGNPSLGLYCVRSGKVKLYKTSKDGKQQILKIAGPGDLIGHSSPGCGVQVGLFPKNSRS